MDIKFVLMIHDGDGNGCDGSHDGVFGHHDGDFIGFDVGADGGGGHIPRRNNDVSEEKMGGLSSDWQPFRKTLMLLSLSTTRSQ